MIFTKCAHSIAMLILTLTCLMAGALLSSCQQPEARVSDARTNVVEAKKELSEAEQNAANERYKDWQPFKTDSEAKLRSNARVLDDFKVKMAASTATFRDRYEQRVTELEHRNSDLKDKISDYRDEGATKLKDFQREVTRDMDGLDTAIKDLPTSNE